MNRVRARYGREMEEVIDEDREKDISISIRMLWGAE